MTLSSTIQKLSDDFRAEVPDHAGFCGRIVLPDGREAGQTLSLKGHPAQEAILRALDSGKYRKFAWAKPVQDGGTLVMFLPLLRRAVVERQKVVLAYPSVDAAKDIWSTKLWPILASYGGQSPESGGGSKGGAARLVKLPGGGAFMLRAAGGRGESGQASITGDVLGVDEVDDWPDLHRIELISRRITESPDPLAVFCCTVKRDGEKGSDKYSLILQLVDEGTNGHLEYPCPKCEKFQRMEWDNIDLVEHGYRCKCGHLWTEHERRQAFANWREVQENEKSDFWSIKWTALDSPRKSIPQLIREYERAAIYAEAGNHGPMRSFFRDRLTKGYQGDQQKDEHDQHTPHNHRTLHARSLLTANHFAPDILREDKSETGLFSRYFIQPPAAVTRVVAAIDVQRNRLYTTITGMDDQRRTYDIGWSIEYARPSVAGAEPPPFSPGDLAKTLEQAADWAEDSIDQKIWMGGVVDVSDPGEHGNAEAEIIDWLVSRKGWNAIQGEKNLTKATPYNHYKAKTDLLNWNTKWRPKARLGSFHVVTDNAQRVVQKSFLIEQSLPGAGLLPGGIQKGSHYLRHLCAVGEVRTKKDLPKWEKLPGAGRFDWLDCRAYATAVLLMHHQEKTMAKTEETQKETPKPAHNDGGYLSGLSSSFSGNGGSWI
jgi:phage terminase large subunit GpA-like protein